MSDARALTQIHERPDGTECGYSAVLAIGTDGWLCTKCGATGRVSDDCCCYRGAARGDEYPEAPCRNCPVHQDHTSDHQCRRHSKGVNR